MKDVYIGPCHCVQANPPSKLSLLEMISDLHVNTYKMAALFSFPEFNDVKRFQEHFHQSFLFIDEVKINLNENDVKMVWNSLSSKASNLIMKHILVVEVRNSQMNSQALRDMLSSGIEPNAVKLIRQKFTVWTITQKKL